jgi:hypothetical protein
MVTVLGTIFLISKGVFFFLVCGGVKGLFVVKPYTVVMVREGFLSCLFHKMLLSTGPVCNDFLGIVKK